MLQKKEAIYFGGDESNHGRFPEIFVVVASTFPEDIEIYDNCPEIRDAGVLFSAMGDRDYRYSVITADHYKKYEKGLAVRVFSGLVNSFGEQAEKARIYIDGALQIGQKRSLRNLVKPPFDQLKIVDVPKQQKNRTNNLVAFADGLANYIYWREYFNDVPEDIRGKKVFFW